MRYKVNFEVELKKHNFPGLYIALEGIDGSGKTTQAKTLASYYKNQGRDVVVTAEPQRQGMIGKLVHEILQGNKKVSNIALQYLFSADRAEHQKDLIIPSLKKGKVVISDRTLWSAVAYGILDRGGKPIKEDADRLLVALSIISMYHQFLIPDANIYLDVSVKEAMNRLSKKSKTEIYEKKELINSVRKIYEFLNEEFKEAFIKLDGSKSISDVTRQIINIVDKK